MQKAIVMYSTSWCPDCIRAEWVLKDKKCIYQKVDIELDEQAAQLVMKYANGKRVVPTLVITDENGHEQVLVNPKPQELISAIN